SYSLYDAESNNYKVYNSVLNMGTAPRYIPISQAFFVQAFASGAYLKYDETYKTMTGVAFEREEEDDNELPIPPHLFFSIHGDNGTSDQSLLAFTDDATDGFDWNFDAQKLWSMNKKQMR